MLTSISMSTIVDRSTAELRIPDMIRTDEYGLKTIVSGKTVSPRTVVSLSEPYRLEKNGGKTVFTLKRFSEGYYVCSCPAWRFSEERDKMRKTCTHLAEVLGKEYERERVKVAREAPSSIWEADSSRRSSSGPTVGARHAQAKTILDSHLREMSQRGSQARTGPEASQSLSTPTSTTPTDVSPSPRAASPEAEVKPSATPVGAAASTSVAGSPNKKRMNQDSDSDTEPEEEEPSLPRTLSALPTTSQPIGDTLADEGAAAWPKTPEPGSDDDLVKADQPSPSKRARARKGDDDKVSLLLAKPWILDPDPSKSRSKAMDPTGWWISEKLDGVRAYWDGQRLYSRQKIEWNAPAWWKNRLPKDITLDGELWMRRGAFDQTSQICRTTVRMGKLQTFKHVLERDSMERAWLREQLGGRLASQERLRQEELLQRERAVRRPRLRRHPSSASAIKSLADRSTDLVGPMATAAARLLEAVRSGGRPEARWRSQKRAALRLERELVVSCRISRCVLVHLSLRSLLLTSCSGDTGRERRPAIDRRSGSVAAMPAAAAVTRKCTRGCKGRRSASLPKPKSACISSRSQRPAGTVENAEAETLCSPPSPCPPPSPRDLLSPRLCTVAPPSRAPRAAELVVGNVGNGAADAVQRPPRRRPRRSTAASALSRRPSRFHPANFSPAWRSDPKKSSEWHQIKFMLFDSPSMSAQPVEDRWAELERRFGSTDGGDIDALEGPLIKLLHHVKCSGRENMLDMLKEVDGKGGEGLMLRHPASHYEFGRSNTLYKLKSFYDAEAVVVGHDRGIGRNASRTGALVARMECGTVFRVGTGLSDAQRENPPPVGTVISYRFQQISEDGYPRFPSFRGVAHDKTGARDAVLRPRAARVGEE